MALQEPSFVRNHAPTPRIDVATYRLRVGGPAVTRPLELGLDDVKSMPSRSVTAFIECGGNWRRFSAELTGRSAPGDQWGTEALVVAEWTGIPLGALLERAGVTDEAVDVDLVGLDECAFRRPVSIEKASHEDTLIAWAMNGAALTPDHGYPLRAVVPGWVGSSSIKWLGRIDVSREPILAPTNTTSYVLIGDAWPREGAALGKPIHEQTLKSALALDRPARLSAGTHILHGFAHGPRPPQGVHWSADGGRTWRAARFTEPALRWSLRRFEVEWTADPGSHVLMTRATDDRGTTQPMPPIPHNERGYVLNAVLPHPIEVV